MFNFTSLGDVEFDDGKGEMILLYPNLVARAFLRREEGGREKTLASAGHVTKLNGTLSTNVCKCLENPRF